MLNPRVAGGFAVLAGVLTLATSAHAVGSYSVYACQGPAGQPVAANGWTADREGDALAANDCATGGPLAVGLNGAGPWKGGLGAEQRFTAPAGTKVGSLHLRRKTGGLPGSHGLAYFFNADGNVLDSCNPGPSSCTVDLDGTLDIPNLDASVLRFRAGCFESYPDECTSNGSPFTVQVSQLVIGLKDTAAPTVANVNGPLADGSSNKGTLGVSFDAADAGAGLYQIIVAVDGTTIAVHPVAFDTCVDAGPGNADPYEFLAQVPCPLSINQLSTSLDTTKLANGPHTVDVVIEDAAGNRTAVLSQKPLTVDNPPPPVPVTPSSLNGINADTQATLKAFFVKNRARSLRNRFGTRVVVRGTLVNRKGVGIQGARLDVYHRPNGGGKLKTLVKTGLKTRAKGEFTLILPLDLTTREVIFAYRARRPGPINSQQVLHLTVVSKNGNVMHRRPVVKRKS